MYVTKIKDQSQKSQQLTVHRCVVCTWPKGQEASLWFDSSAPTNSYFETLVPKVMAVGGRLSLCGKRWEVFMNGSSKL